MTEQVKLPTTLDALSRTKTGEAKRDQVIKLQPHKIAVREGFNVRGVGLGAEYWEQEHVKAHIDAIALSYTNGEHVPPIVVKWDVDSQLAYIVDGHHRYKGLMKAIENGAPIQYVKVEQFSGDESTQQLLMFKSGNSLELTAVEKAEVIHRLVSYGFEPQEIANKIGKSITFVSYMQKVYDLPIEKKRLIQQGKLTVNSALRPDEDKETAKQRKLHRKATNKVIDALISSENVEVENNMAKISIPLELWEAFKLAQADKIQEVKIEEAVKAFKENQTELPLAS